MGVGLGLGLGLGLELGDPQQYGGLPHGVDVGLGDVEEVGTHAVLPLRT